VSGFTWPVRVYYEDTDSGGVVYYANYLKFMERARTEWLRSHDFEQDVLARDEKVVFVVRSLGIDFFRPARFNDLLHVNSSVAEARNVSLTFDQEIAQAGAGGNLICRGRVKVACVDGQTFRPRPIPRKIRVEIAG
jgi:acyl-CoA thioester hydrolase